MTRRQITTRHIAAGVELFVLAAALAACAASTGNSATAPAGSNSAPAANTAGAAPAAGGSASTGSGEENAPDSAATDGNSAAVDPANPTATASPASADLTIKDNVVSPASLTVSPGEHVAIANSDAVAHALSDGKDKLSSGVMKAENSGALTAPKSAGTYRLTDPSHSATHVTLVVK
jgi:plastocyanin